MCYISKFLLSLSEDSIKELEFRMWYCIYNLGFILRQPIGCRTERVDTVMNSARKFKIKLNKELKHSLPSPARKKPKPSLYLLKPALIDCFILIINILYRFNQTMLAFMKIEIAFGIYACILRITFTQEL